MIDLKRKLHQLDNGTWDYDADDYAAVLEYAIKLEDHTWVARLLCSGEARWESKTKELCFNGIRFSTNLDEFGVPELHLAIRGALERAGLK